MEERVEHHDQHRRVLEPLGKNNSVLYGDDEDGARSESRQPFFSVIIPTYERPQHLRRGLEALARQTFSDFEVIVVDQSASPEPLPPELCERLRPQPEQPRHTSRTRLQVLYSAQRGPASARNRGLEQARGDYVAFTDDDCLAAPRWLERAAKRLRKTRCAGLEGRVGSRHLGDPRYRTQSNVGVEGLGFMTANLILRRKLVERAGGFDERFSSFREDTDLAWRVMELGKIPHAADVIVYHCPHLASAERESAGERVKMFACDALLFAKHPRRYPELLLREGHHRNTAGFWTHFVNGLAEFKLNPPVGPLLNYLRDADPQWWAGISFERRNRAKAMTDQDLASLCRLLALNLGR